MKKLLLATALCAAFGVASAAEDVTADIVVIGAGGAGLSAAVQAHDLGAKVIVVEKMAMPGGNTVRAAGGLNACCTPLQKAKGTKDSTEIMFADTMKGGHWKNNPELVRTLVNNSGAAVDWLLALGGDFRDVGLMAGASQPRTHRPTGGALVGPEVIRTLYTAAKARQIDMRMNTQAVEITKNGKGAVTGLVVKGKDGSYKINAKAVVNAAGGFAGNNDLVSKYVPRLKGFATTNHPGATGEGLLKMLAIGGAPVQIDQIQLGPWCSPDERGFGLVSQFNTVAGFPMGIMVDVRNGERFCNELADRKERTDAILGLMQDGKPVYPVSFTDSKGVEKAQTLKNGLKYGVIKKFDTVEDLAKAYGIPADKLVATVKRWNEMVAKKDDKDFHRALDLAIQLDKPPFYAARVWPKVHYCMGGVGITPKAEVVNVEGRVIPGLFACGEVTGGTHGASRLGGCAIADGLVMGRVAAQSAVKNAPVNL